METARWFMLVPVGVHLYWAFALILVGPLMVTPKAALLMFFANDERWLLSTLIAVSISGMSGIYLYWRNKWAALLFLLPQQVVLLFSAGACVVSVIYGIYADGEVRSPWFIAADQMLFVLFSIAHSAAMIELATAKDGDTSTS